MISLQPRKSLLRYRPFEEARKHVASLKLKDQSQFRSWAVSKKRPADIPHNPKRFYSDKWVSWEHFLRGETYIPLGFSLGTDSQSYRPFEEARKHVARLKLKDKSQFRSWAVSKKRPADIPYNPTRIYSDKWVSWEHFLGNGSDLREDAVAPPPSATQVPIVCVFVWGCEGGM